MPEYEGDIPLWEDRAKVHNEKKQQDKKALENWIDENRIQDSKDSIRANSKGFPVQSFSKEILNQMLMSFKPQEIVDGPDITIDGKVYKFQENFEFLI